jgi:hypothetical protein
VEIGESNGSFGTVSGINVGKIDRPSGTKEKETADKIDIVSRWF